MKRKDYFPNLTIILQYVLIKKKCHVVQPWLVTKYPYLMLKLTSSIFSINNVSQVVTLETVINYFIFLYRSRGKALVKIGEYTRGLKELQMAYNMEPKDKDIYKEICLVSAILSHHLVFFSFFVFLTSSLLHIILFSWKMIGK